MAKGDTQTQQQTQNSTSEPWAPAQGLLKSILGKYSGLNTDVTSGQSGALSSLSDALSGIPNFGASAADSISKLFSSDTSPQIGMLKDAFSGLTSNLGGTASGAELDPYSTPGFGDAISTAMNDITNRVKGVFAGSGRDPSGAGSFAQSLGRGLTQGVAPTLAAQFNQNKANQMNAASTLYSAGGDTAGKITGQQQTPLQNAIAAISNIPGLIQSFAAPASAQLGAATQAFTQPFSNISSLLSGVLPIAGLGGQTSGNSTGTVTQPQSTLSNVLGGLSGGIGLLSFLSDEESKENIAPVGKLNDGQKIYRFNYKGDPRPQIGLLAQEVQEHEPAAVTRDPGLGMLKVHYGMATRRAARMGHRRAA